MRYLKSVIIFIFLVGANFAIAADRKPVPESAADIKPVEKGSKIPEISLSNSNGKKFNLNESLKKQPAVIIFYRGGWCPYCNLHLAGLQKIESELLKLDYRIFAISPDLPEKLIESTKKHKLSYTLLSDSKMSVAKAFGIAFKVDDATIEKYKGYGINLEEASGEKHNLLPVPSVFIIGKDGLIKYSYVNPDYKVRLSPEKILTAAKSALNIKKDKFEMWTSEYNDMLQKYVVSGEKKGIKSNLVDYQNLRKTDSVKLLKDKLGKLPSPLKLEEKKQIALWLNIYNFLAISMVVDNPGIKSLKDLSGWFDPVWKQDAGTVAGKTYSLDEIEHGIVRKKFKEPRVHVALVCAALSCPNLRTEAYSPEKLDEQLNDQMKTFLANNKKGMRIDQKNKTIYLSKIFKWFDEDFSNEPKNWLIKKSFIPQKYKDYDIDFFDYDWKLNSK